MSNEYFEDQVFEKKDFTAAPLAADDYERCRFVNCNLERANLSGLRFSDCSFNGCNLSMALLGKTSFQDIEFMDCKLQGLHFYDCNPVIFTVSFKRCLLNLSSFFGFRIKKTLFSDCELREVDFTQADLSECIFDRCDLDRAVFENTTLCKTDFRTAFRYSIDPEKNRVKRARFNNTGLAGLLHKYDLDISQY